jgi:hypothetical protein
MVTPPQIITSFTDDIILPDDNMSPVYNFLPDDDLSMITPAQVGWRIGGVGEGEEEKTSLKDNISPNQIVL